LEEADGQIIKSKPAVKPAEKPAEKKSEAVPAEKVADLAEDKAKAKDEVAKSEAIPEGKKQEVAAKVDAAADEAAVKKTVDEAKENKAGNAMNIRQRLAAIRARKSAEKDQKVDSVIIREDSTLRKPYDANKAPVSQAASVDKSVKDLAKVDRKWLQAMAEKIAFNKISKFKKAVEIVGESQLKDVNVDPLKTAMVRNLVDYGIREADAKALVDNAFIDAKQQSTDQLLEKAEELNRLETPEFVSAKLKISAYVPGTAKVAEGKTERRASITTVVSGVGAGEKSVNYAEVFDSSRPLGAI